MDKFFAVFAIFAGFALMLYGFSLYSIWTTLAGLLVIVCGVCCFFYAGDE